MIGMKRNAYFHFGIRTMRYLPMSETAIHTLISGKYRFIILASLTYLFWVIVTYLLEGRILTFLRPEAAPDRIVYTLVANILVGIILSLWVLKQGITTGTISLDTTGFRPLKRTIIAVMIAFLAGLAILMVQHQGPLHPVILLNVYAQVLTVTIAEIAICWCLIGSAAEAILARNGRIIAIIGGILAASFLFGLYHAAHSPPFNQPGMILLLTFIGIVTSLVYFIGRDIYATMAFHNFLGCIGIIQALETTGSIALYETPLIPIMGMAVISIGIFIAIDIQYIRKISPVPT